MSRRILVTEDSFFLAVVDCPGLLDAWACPVLVGDDDVLLEHGATVSTGEPVTRTGNGCWYKLVGAHVGLFPVGRLYVDTRRPEVAAMICAWLVREILPPDVRQSMTGTAFTSSVRLGPVAPGVWGLTQVHQRLRTWEADRSGWGNRGHVPGLQTAWHDKSLGTKGAPSALDRTPDRATPAPWRC